MFANCETSDKFARYIPVLLLPSLFTLSFFATLETSSELDPICIPQLFLGLLLGTSRSAIGQLFFPVPKNIPEVFAKVISDQLPSLSKVVNCFQYS